MSDEISVFQIQLEQVHVALAAEPDNQTLLKLKEDLEETIRLQQELNESKEKKETSNKKPNKYEESNQHRWKVGDRCMAKNKSGNRQLAVIDGITQDKAAITFSNGIKDLTKLSDLGVAPVVEQKNYVFESNSSSKNDVKKDWRQEKERRKLRAQKKEQRRKQIEEEQEKEKKSWKNFNQKAMNKNLRGIKKITATASAQDGPRSGTHRSNANIISSRTGSVFGSTNRGNMDSLF